MSYGLVGMRLRTALHCAGHHEWHTVHTQLDFMTDDIMVRLYAGVASDRKCVDFRIPNRCFDQVEYAKEKWPSWFVKKEPVSGEQLDLFNQE